MIILSDWPLRVTCQSGRSLALAHCVLLEVAMATTCDAGSATAAIIAFLLEGTPSRACLVGRRSLLARGVRPSVHVPLCAHGGQFSEHACEPTAGSLVPASLSPKYYL